MLHCTAFDEVSLRYIWVVGYHTVRIAKPQLHIGIRLGSTEEDDVTKTFAWSMLARDIVGVWINTIEMSDQHSWRQIAIVPSDK